MAIKVTIGERDENNIIDVSFETEPGRASEDYKKTLRRVGGNISIKGFRKGKAPLKVIEEYVGAEQVKAETLNNTFISKLFEEVFQQEDMNVVHISNIEKVEFDDPDESIKVEAKVELFPEVNLPKYEEIKLSVTVPKFDIEEQEKETLERILDNNSVFEESEEPIEMKDEIIFDFDGSYQNEEGEWIPKAGMKAEKYQIIVEPGRFIENFLEQMVGMKVDEEKELDVTFPEGYHDPDLDGKPAKFKVKVHKISKPKKPELDDELAKKMNFDDVKTLKEKVREEIEKNAEDTRRSITSEAVIKELVDRVEVQLSKSMIEREVDHDLALLQKQNGWDDDKLKQYISELNMEDEEKAAADKLKRSVIVTTVIKEEKLEASPEDVQAEFAKYNFPPDFDMSKVNVPAVVQRLNLDILSRKAIETIAEKADIQYDELSPEEFEKQTGTHVHGAHCDH